MTLDEEIDGLAELVGRGDRLEAFSNAYQAVLDHLSVEILTTSDLTTLAHRWLRLRGLMALQWGFVSAMRTMVVSEMARDN